jgi:Rieske Fe-S protein
MNRRTVFLWISRAIGLACAALVAVPGIRFLISPLRERRRREAIVQRVTRLDALQPGVPEQFALTGSRQDGWMQFPEQTIGRVWLVRRTDDAVPPEQAKVDVFTAVCPHLGCVIQFDPAAGDFVCPCHMAVFELSGRARGNQELGRVNPAPRAMDLLNSQLVQHEATGQWWVEVEYQEFKNGLPEKVPLL